MRTTKSNWLVAAATVVLTAAMLESAAARTYCARLTDGSTNCGFHTRAQCGAAVSGVGGFCSVNPRTARRLPRARS